LAAAEELNPAMGWRAIRIGLDRPMLLRRQLRALVQAAQGGPLSVMVPMIAEVAELTAARGLLDIELAAARSQGLAPPQPLRVGVMVEVPALLWQLDALLPRVDFLSIGSNDLMQFLFASDRSNPRLADRYDVLSPAALGLLGALARRCTEAGVAATVCGEMAGQPLEAMALIGLGFRRLSMAAPALGPVRAMLRSLEVAPLADYMARLAALPDRSVRGKLRAFARDHGVEV
jgi:phosphotransferase system enzyme I (PtsP)